MMVHRLIAVALGLLVAFNLAGAITAFQRGAVEAADRFLMGAAYGAFALGALSLFLARLRHHG